MVNDPTKRGANLFDDLLGIVKPEPPAKVKPTVGERYHRFSNTLFTVRFGWITNYPYVSEPYSESLAKRGCVFYGFVCEVLVDNKPVDFRDYFCWRPNSVGRIETQILQSIIAKAYAYRAMTKAQYIAARPTQAAEMIDREWESNARADQFLRGVGLDSRDVTYWNDELTKQRNQEGRLSNQDA